MDITNEQAAYVAGAIDGEGHIGITRRRAGLVEWQRSAQFRCNITIANTNKAWLEELQRWVGGLVHRTSVATERRREGFVLAFNGTHAKALLMRVAPYLLMKRRQSEIALRYYEVAAKRRLFSVNAQPTNPAIVAELDALYQEMRGLNLHRLVQAKPSGRKPDRKCSAEGCDRKHYGKGYCWTHYRKFLVRGGPAHYEKPCAVCGTVFVARRSDTECCSRKCTDKRYYAMHSEEVKAKASRQRRRQSDKDAPLPAASN